MHKFKIDTIIIDDFLNHRDLEIYYQTDIYMIEDHSIFMMPLNPNYERIRLIKIKVVELLKNFYLSDEQKYYYFIEHPELIEEKIIIKIVVGLPNNITKLFRSTINDEIIIILDLANYCYVMSDNNEIIEDINDYLGYALTLMVLDANIKIDNSNPIALFEHTVYCTSMAYYISESNQLNFMRNLDQLNVWLFLEYDTIQKRYLRKNKAKMYVEEYLDVAFRTNPEMVAVGVTGKVFIEDKTCDEVMKIYKEGSKQFLKQIYKQQDLRFISRMIKALSIIEALIIPLLIVWLITIVVFLITKELKAIVRIIPLITIFLLTLKESLKYKLMRSSYLTYLLKVLIYLFSSIMFLFLT